MIFNILDYRDRLDYKNKPEADKTAWQIAQNDREYIENSLFSHLFKGDEFLDDGIIRVLSFTGTWGMERLFALVFSDDSVNLTRWNIAAIAKHCSDRLSTSWDIVIKWITKMRPVTVEESITPSSFITTKSSAENMGFIIPRYFYKVSKLRKDKLIKTIKIDTICHLNNNPEFITMFPCKAYDVYGYVDARSEIKYSLEKIISKISTTERLFEGDSYIKRILERLISEKDCILTLMGRNNMINTINQLSKEYSEITCQRNFEEWLDKYCLIFYDLVISGKLKEFIISDEWAREILFRCKPVSDTAISKAFEIINSETLIKSDKAEFNLKSYSFRVFESLIRIMNLKAIDMLYDYLVVKEILPSQSIAASFDFGIKNIYFAEKDYSYVYTKMCESIGHRWELICRSISRYLYGDRIIVHAKLGNGYIPDIAIQDELYSKEKYPLIIECKRRYNIGDIEACTLKYASYCDKLEFWVLEPKLNNEGGTYFYLIDPLFRQERNSYLKSIKADARTRIVFIEDVLDKIRGNTFLVNEVNLLITENQGITYAYVIKNQIEKKVQNVELKKKLIFILEILAPYLNMK